jgi:hypothetical protein
MAIRIITFLILALAIPFGGSAQEGVVVSYDATYAYFAPKFAFPPRVERDGMRNALELVSDRNHEAKGEINLEQFIDERVIDELEREGFFKRLR